MQSVLVIMYATMLLTVMFGLYFIILRYFGMTNKDAALALLACTGVSLVINLFIDFYNRSVGFIQ